MSRHLFRIATPLLLATLLAAADSSARGLGVMEIHAQDAARGGRPVPLLVWYPALADGPGAAIDPSPAEGFPLIVFGHAYLTQPEAYAWLGETVVRRGWIVALPRTEMSFPADQRALAADLRFAGAFLWALAADPSSLLHGRIAPATAYGGHSLGGGAAKIAAAADAAEQPEAVPPRAVFSFALLDGATPSVRRDAGAVVSPALMLAGARDCVTPPAQHQEPVWEALGSTVKTLVTLLEAGHCGFAAETPECAAAEANCPPSALDAARIQASAGELLAPWLDWSVRGDPEAAREFRRVLAALQDQADVRAAWAPVAIPDPAERAAHLRLQPAYPNPANPRVALRLALARPDRVRLSIHDAAGRLVRRLADTAYAAGPHEVVWDGRDCRGAAAPSGSYIARAQTRDGALTAKFTLVR